jgi:NADPH-dependent ferric siderophore reductase
VPDLTPSVPPFEVITREAKVRRLEVRRAERITPRMVRVTFGGEDLADYETQGPDDDFRIFFPLPGEDRPVLPSLETGGFVWPEGANRPQNREYTPRRFDPGSRELHVDFVVHGDGPGSVWADNAAPGQFAGSVGPRRSRVMSPAVTEYLLFGDESALPSIGRRLEELPAGVNVRAFVEIADPDEEQRIDTRANLDLTWLHRNGAEPGTTTLLEQAAQRITSLSRRPHRRLRPGGADAGAGSGLAWGAGDGAGTARTG